MYVSAVSLVRGSVSGPLDLVLKSKATAAGGIGGGIEGGYDPHVTTDQLVIWDKVRRIPDRSLTRAS